MFEKGIVTAYLTLAESFKQIPNKRFGVSIWCLRYQKGQIAGKILKYPLGIFSFYAHTPASKKTLHLFLSALEGIIEGKTRLTNLPHSWHYLRHILVSELLYAYLCRKSITCTFTKKSVNRKISSENPD